MHKERRIADPTAAEETIGGDSPLCPAYVQDLMSKLMLKGGDIWDVKKLLKQMESDNPYFQWAMKTNAQGAPEVIAWATIEMRRDLLRFHDSLFIDMRKTVTNNLGWNYFGPTVKDGDMKVRVVAECLCCVEDQDMYAWVLRKLECFEPDYSLKQTRFIFADNLVTEELLHMLGINQTCQLRADSHHCLHEDWPKLFGDRLW